MTVSDRGYNPYENGYQRVGESFPKNQYPDYDRTVYDTYHPEENSAYSEQEQLPSSSYISSDYPQVNLPSPSQQGSYSSREDSYETHRMSPQKPLRSEEYSPIDRPILKQPHRSHTVHEPKTVSDQESYMVGPDDRSQPYVPYVDMPRTDFRMVPNIRAQDMRMPSSGIAADMADMYNRDEAIRKSLSQQLQALHNDPVMMSDHLPGNTANTPIPTMLKPKISAHLSPGTGHGSAMEKPRVAAVEHHHELPKVHHQVHNIGPTATTAGHAISAKKLTAASAKSSNVQAHPHESSNAVIILAMGLIITGVLIVLVGCRLRTLRRKTIRRGRNLSHDADYLVNGLYL